MTNVELVVRNDPITRIELVDVPNYTSQAVLIPRDHKLEVGFTEDSYSLFQHI
uniref:Uncharacterized protein n=1 Tax=Solanum lycopersicum TaxID=4081 RepID=K4CS72_SOLLC